MFRGIYLPVKAISRYSKSRRRGLMRLRESGKWFSALCISLPPPLLSPLPHLHLLQWVERSLAHLALFPCVRCRRLPPPCYRAACWAGVMRAELGVLIKPDYESRGEQRRLTPATPLSQEREESYSNVLWRYYLHIKKKPNTLSCVCLPLSLGLSLCLSLSACRLTPASPLS